MNLFTIALKSLRQRLLVSSLTALSVGLGVMLIVVVPKVLGATNSMNIARRFWPWSSFPITAPPRNCTKDE